MCAAVVWDTLKLGNCVVSSAFIIPSIYNYGTILNKSNTRPKTGGRSPKGYDLSRWLYIAVVAKLNWRATFINGTSMVVASIAKTISGHYCVMKAIHNVLYARVPWWYIIYIQYIGTWLKWSRQHVNFTVSDWNNVMFTNVLRFALKLGNKSVKIWGEQGLRTSSKITHSEMEASWCGLEFRSDNSLTCISIEKVLWQLYCIGMKSLEPTVRLQAAAIGSAVVFMDHNAHPDTSHIIDHYLKSEMNPCVD